MICLCWRKQEIWFLLPSVTAWVEKCRSPCSIKSFSRWSSSDLPALDLRRLLTELANAINSSTESNPFLIISRTCNSSTSRKYHTRHADGQSVAHLDPWSFSIMASSILNNFVSRRKTLLPVFRNNIFMIYWSLLKRQSAQNLSGRAGN